MQPGQIQAGADAPGIIDADSPPRKASIQVKRSIIAKAHTRRVTSKHAKSYNKVDNKVKQLRKKSVGAFLAHNVVEKKSLMAFFSSLNVDERGEVTKKSFEEFCMPNDSKVSPQQCRCAARPRAAAGSGTHCRRGTRRPEGGKHRPGRKANAFCALRRVLCARARCRFGCSLACPT